MTVRLLSLVLLSLVGSQSFVRADHFKSDGTNIYYTVKGKGEPVVLIHGFGVDQGINWGSVGVIRKLARAHKVIAMDVRGHGKSDKPHDAKDYGNQMAKDVLNLLDHLKIKKAHLVGYSMGGFIVMKLMEKHPERIITATLGGSGGIREDYEFQWSDQFANALSGGKSFIEALLSAWPPGSAKPGKFQLRIMEQVFGKNDLKAMTAVLKSWHDLKVPYKTLARNKVPTLFLYGTEEVAKAFKYIEKLKGRMPNATFVTIQGANHMDTFARRDFIRSLRAFLQKHSQ